MPQALKWHLYLRTGHSTMSSVPQSVGSPCLLVPKVTERVRRSSSKDPSPGAALSTLSSCYGETDVSGGALCPHGLPPALKPLRNRERALFTTEHLAGVSAQLRGPALVASPLCYILLLPGIQSRSAQVLCKWWGQKLPFTSKFL